MQARDHLGNPIPFTISFYTCSRINGKRVNEHTNHLRNIYVPEAQQFYKVYIWLIERFNGQTVDWQ